jgi:HPr kinase/phosphorylase
MAITALPLDLTEHGDRPHAADEWLLNPNLPFARLNPLEPTPITLIDPSLRAALAARHETLPRSVILAILTEADLLDAERWQTATDGQAMICYSPHHERAVVTWLMERRQRLGRQWQHGVFMEVAGAGVLITGHSGIGKSELALELLSRGHRLIADDAPYFIATADGIEGHCPDNIRNLLEVRGLGIIDIRALFGDNALKQQKILRLVIELYAADHARMSAEDRLHGERGQVRICQQSVPLFRLPIAPGRNIAVFVETIVRQHNLERGGNDHSRLPLTDAGAGTLV